MKTKQRMFIVILGLLAWQFIGGTEVGFTQNYPGKPIRLIVPFTTGGGNDLLARLIFASTGIGGAAHLRGELFKSKTGTDIVHVPYKGTSPAVIDLLAGRVSMSFTDLFPTIPHAKAGKLRILAVSGTKRAAALPEVPTMTEAGVSGFESGQWFGLVAPTGTPKEIIARLNAEIVKIMHLSEVKERLHKVEGLEPMGSTPAEFDAHIKAEVTKWAKVIKDAGIPVGD